MLPDLLAPLRALITTLLSTAHDGLAVVGLPSASGATWLLAVAALVVLVRAVLLPLAVLQFRSAVRMRALAPDLHLIRERYARRTDPAAREAMAREMLALQREHGVRPLAPILPLIVQVPVFLALLQALEQAARGTGDAALASFALAAVLGAPLAATALSGGWPALVGVGLLLVTAGAQMLTQHLATTGPTPLGGLLMLLPVATAAGGLLFPIGVTAYWCVSALWTLGQQVVLTRLITA